MSSNIRQINGGLYYPSSLVPFDERDQIPAIRLGPAAGKHEGRVLLGTKHFDQIMMGVVAAIGMDGTELVGRERGWVDRKTGEFFQQYFPDESELFPSRITIEQHQRRR